MKKANGKFDNEGNLEGFSRELPFRTPDQYFDWLPDQVILNLESIPTETSASSSQPFKVPEGYFDTLHAAVQDRITGKRIPGPSFTFWRAYRPQFALTLATFLILFVVLFRSSTRVITVPDSEPFVLTADELSHSYLMEDLDEHLIADMLEDPGTTQETGDDGVTEYLIDNNIDLSQIDIEL